MVFIAIKRPENYRSFQAKWWQQNGKQHCRIILNQSSVKYLELHILTVDAKRPKKLVNDALYFSVHYQPEEILYISTTDIICHHFALKDNLLAA